MLRELSLFPIELVFNLIPYNNTRIPAIFSQFSGFTSILSTSVSGCSCSKSATCCLTFSYFAQLSTRCSALPTTPQLTHKSSSHLPLWAGQTENSLYDFVIRLYEYLDFQYIKPTVGSPCIFHLRVRSLLSLHSLAFQGAMLLVQSE